MKILVVSNCQTLHIHRAVESLVDGAQVESLSMNQFGDRAAEFAATIASYDIVIGLPDMFALLEKNKANLDCIEKIIMPPFRFHAFHPDAFYLKVDGEILKTVMGDYHSIIVFCGYINGLSIEQIERLFDGSIFEQLGYLNIWADQESYLSELYSDWGFDVRQWLQQKFVRGCFMHSFNHPYPEIVVDLVKFGFSSLGLNIEKSNYSFFPDYLSNGPIWPVYTDIADRLSIEGSMEFKPEGQFSTIGLSTFIHECVDTYHREDILNRFLEPICYHSGYLRAIKLMEQL